MSKNRSDSVDGLTDIFKAASDGVAVPETESLTDEEMEYWPAITQTKMTWTKVDLIFAVHLAQTWASIRRNKALLDKEGDVIENARGTLVSNPRFAILEQLTRRSTALASKIQIHSAATQGVSKLQKAKNTAKREAVETMSDMDDDLISRPH